jgi:membrane protease YdiL (CAAX protease family)
MSSPSLTVEFIVLFILLPLGYRFSRVRIPALPVLWVITIYCGTMLYRDPSFSRSSLWNASAFAPNLVSVLGVFLLLGSLIVAGVRLFVPETMFSLIRKRPRVWAAVMVFYPILSVYPQGIIYRSFLMHRYAALFPGDIAVVLVSATAFGFMHIIFRNPLAVLMTFFGGLLFAWRYQQTGSLLVSATEHALYGCLLFTVGLGDYFYHGAIKLSNPVLLPRR